MSLKQKTLQYWHKLNLKLNRRTKTGLAVIVFAASGLYLLSISQAATQHISSEAESGTIGGNATARIDTSASTGQAVQFGKGPGGKLIFQDDFTAPPLMSTWMWGNPSNAANYQLANGAFNMTVPAGNDQWVNVDMAPRLLKSQPAGDWTAETRITSETAGAVFGGLTIFGDQANWLLWGQLGNNSLEASGIIGNAAVLPFSMMATQYDYLRVRKAGNIYHFDASADGTHWNNANIYTDTAGVLNNARIGLLVKNWAAPGSGSYTMSFDYYKEYDKDIMPSVLADNVTTTQIAQETGYDTLNDTRKVGFCGTDLGEMFTWLGKTFFAFGDTGRCIPEPPDSNVLAYSSDDTPADGLLFDGWATDSAGNAKEIIDKDAGAFTSIPTHGVGIGNNAYIYYMNVKEWDPAPPAPQDRWTCTGSSTASANSADIGAWTKQPAVSWAPGNFNIVTVAQKDDTLYIWGTPCGRMESVKLMKVGTADVLKKTAYRYFTGVDVSGSPQWSNNELDAVTVVGGPVGEPSVMYNAWLGRYTMTYLDERKAALMLRESPTPWGNWSAPIQLAHASQYPQLYGAFMHPKYVENNGQSFYYMMSQFGPYNTFLMKSTLQRR